MTIFFNLLNLQKNVYKIIISTKYCKKRIAVAAAIQTMNFVF